MAKREAEWQFNGDIWIIIAVNENEIGHNGLHACISGIMPGV
jgi:hypothetical protein